MKNNTRKGYRAACLVLVGATWLLACQSDRPSHAHPEGAMPAVDAPDGNFAGEVVERLGAGTYTYMHVRTEGDLQWVVTLGGGSPVGTRVAVTNMGVRTNFQSRRLDRVFPRLVFGIVRSTT